MSSIKFKNLNPKYDETFMWILDAQLNNHYNNTINTLQKQLLPCAYNIGHLGDEFNLQVKKSHYKMPNNLAKLQNITISTPNNENIHCINKDKLDFIEFQVWDKDFFKDDFCGNCKLSIIDVLNSDNGKFNLKLENVQHGELNLVVQMKFSTLCDYPNEELVEAFHSQDEKNSKINNIHMNNNNNTTFQNIDGLESVHSTVISKTNFQKSERIKYIGNLFYPIGWRLEKIDEMRVLCRSPTEIYDPEHRLDCLKIELEVGLADQREVYVNSMSKYKNFTDIPLESSTKLGYYYYTFLFQYVESGNTLFQYVCVVDIGSSSAIVVRYISNCALKNQSIAHQIVTNSEFVQGFEMLNVLYSDLFEYLWLRVPFGWQENKTSDSIVFTSPLEFKSSTSTDPNDVHIDRFEISQLLSPENTPSEMSEHDVAQYVKSLIMDQNVEIISDLRSFDLQNNTLSTSTSNSNQEDTDETIPEVVAIKKDTKTIHVNWLQVAHSVSLESVMYELVVIIHRVDDQRSEKKA